jgi:hypothetical protein
LAVLRSRVNSPAVRNITLSSVTRTIPRRAAEGACSARGRSRAVNWFMVEAMVRYRYK